MSNEYHFITRWRIAATALEVYDIIVDPLDYPRWWPAVYLETEQIAPPDLGDSARGIGRRISYHTKGWLPYTLRFESTAVEADRPNRLVIRATGDFNGRGIWTFQQDGEFVAATFDWQLTADKPLLRHLSFLLKPIFAANHVWAMERGRQSLLLELARRRAPSPEARNRVPAPPGPNKTSGILLGLAALAIVGGLIALWLALR